MDGLAVAHDLMTLEISSPQEADIYEFWGHCINNKQNRIW